MLDYFSTNLNLIIQAGVTLVFTVVVAKGASIVIEGNVKRIISKLGREFGAKEETRLTIIRRAIVAIVYFVGIATALYQFPDVARVASAMLASAAVAGLVVGIAAQSLIANFLAGFMNSFSMRFNLGNEIEVSGQRGVIEEITLLHTQIRLKDGNHMMIPNKLLSEIAIINYSLKKEEKGKE